MDNKFSQVKKKATFRYLAENASRVLGSSKVFFIAILLILTWAASGFYYDFNNTWQLIINTGTTIGTFLMVILVQNTQTRESRSIQLKLDELLYGTKNTRNSLMEIEEQSDEEMEEFKQEFKKLREKYIARHKK
jgi:low affinity Fe/Cu permease